VTLPLFALNTLLFPGCMLDLQIFEKRYLDMVSRCMRQGEGFGVVCILEGFEVGEAASQFSAIGCEALIRDFEQLPNGLLGIRVEGGRRFRVERAQVLPDQLTIGDVQWLDEQPEQPLELQHEDLVALLRALTAHPMVQSLGMSHDLSGQAALAHQLSYLLPLELAHKVQLLEMDRADQRLHLLQEVLQQMQEGTQ
jgi:Lon protease-like protein